MSLLIYKYGGTSVGSIECIQAIADNIISERKNGHNIVVVVSAMAGETNRLVDMAKAIQEKPNPREYALLVTTGEQVTAALLSMALSQKGYTARSYASYHIPIITDSNYEMANISRVETTPLINDLEKNIIPIIAGFQGVTEEGELTTLGRGGSDASAVILAAALNADECKIFTDVDGIYTADPKLYSDAKKLDYIELRSMLEMSRNGAKVLQLNAVKLALQHRVSLRVLSSFTGGQGTYVY